MTWGYLLASFWWRGDGGYSSWPLGEKCTGWGMTQSPYWSCGESTVVTNRTSLRPHLSGWQEKWGTWLIVMRVNHHLVLKVADVLHRITYSRVVLECRSGEFPLKFALLDLFERGESWIFVVRVGWSSNLASLIRFWISSSRVQRSGDLLFSGSLFVWLGCSRGLGLGPGAIVWAISTSPSPGGCSRGREPSIPIRDLIVHVASSFALSFRRASEEVGLHIVLTVGCWRLVLVVMRSRCPR